MLRRSSDSSSAVRAGVKRGWLVSAVAALATGLAACGVQSQDPPPPPSGGPGAIDGPDGLRDVPATLTWQDTSPAWSMPGQKLLLTGVIYQPDGVTPASDVVLYYYQTDTEGRYRHRPDEPRSMPPNELGQTHGSIRGWIRTGADGRYEIRTVRPAPYPTGDEPAHVHATIREPGVAEYYIDDFVFDDDPLLTSRKRQRLENRCGSGVLRLVRTGDVFVGERDIILGQNIPNHPRAGAGGPGSGPKIGEDVASFIPYHAWGPDTGTRACPVCKYGWYHGVLYFVGDGADMADVRAWLTFLEQESVRRGDRLKVYLVYGARAGYSKDARERELAALGKDLNLRHVALTFVPSFTDAESEVALNRINPEVRSTIILYRRSRVIDKAVDLRPGEPAFNWLRTRLDQTSTGYFAIPKSGA